MRILAIGAHYDDVELGCGGSLALHRRRGDAVSVCVVSHSGFASADGSVVVRDPAIARQEGVAAAAVLGIDAADVHCLDLPTNDIRVTDDLTGGLRALVDRLRPDLVYTHWTGDAHHDHRAVATASLSACRGVPRLLCYRSNLVAAEGPFPGTLQVDISETFAAKGRALAAHASEYDRVGPRWSDTILGQNRVDGALLGVEAVETFAPIRFLWKEC